MRRCSNVIALTLLIAVGATPGCSRSQISEPAPTGAVAPPAVAAQSQSVVDPALIASLREVGAACTGESGAACIAARLADRGIPGGGAQDGQRLIGTVIEALASADEGLRIASIELIRRTFESAMDTGRAVPTITTADATRLLNAVVSLDPRIAERAIGSATIAFARSGADLKTLYSTLDTLHDRAGARAGYRALMVGAKMAGFARIRDLATTGSSEDLLTAFESVKRMRDWSTTDREEIGAWAFGFAQDERTAIRSRASSLVARAGGAPLRALLEAAHRGLGEGRVDASLLAALQPACARSTLAVPTDARDCARIRTLYEAAAADARLTVETRRTATAMLARNWPDPRTKNILQQVAYAGDPLVRGYASRELSSLSSRVQ